VETFSEATVRGEAAVTRIGEFATLQRTVGELATRCNRLPERALRRHEERVRQSAMHQARRRLSTPPAPPEVIPIAALYRRAGEASRRFVSAGLAAL
jgi:hypothetical protein